MAHGGSSEWNETVLDAVAPLSNDVPTVVAFGMANPGTLTSALDSLRSIGVRRVAVVRMFISGQSFRDRTSYLLGLSAEPPGTFGTTDGGAGAHEVPPPIDHGLTIATHEDGLMVSDEARRIVVERARNLSSHPRAESVLLLAHGMGDDEENGRLLRAMDEIAAEIAESPFASVRSAALREDWAEERSVATGQVRNFVRRQTAAGRRVIVVPVRLSGFGPYAEVLEGLRYAAGEGLLPHREVSTWIRRTAFLVIRSNDWDDPTRDRGTTTERR